MVRTAASAIRVGGKSSKKGSESSNLDRNRASSSTHMDKGASNLNPICPRETPTWQKPITNFFQCIDKPDNHSKNQNNVDVTMESDETNEDAQPISSMIHEPCSQEGHDDNDLNCENKENVEDNGSITENVNVEMKEIDSTTKKRVNIRENDCDDPEYAALRKRFKMDKSFYKNLEKIEQMSNI